MILRTLCLFFIITSFANVLFAKEIDLTGYQKPDGAITTGYERDLVDPYFATQALLVAKEGGMSVDKQSKAWINWILKRQQSQELFGRYQRNLSGGWQRYAPTDADDAMLALWLQLLYQMSPSQGVPELWNTSIVKTEEQLAGLYDAERGIYHISSALPVGLLMDNVEICLAFRKIAVAQKRLGLQKQAAVYQAKADQLYKKIQEVFGVGKENTYLISTQVKNGDHFYPDKVAQLYPVVELINKEQAYEHYEQWMNRYGKEWLAQRENDFPWGLLAIKALEMKDTYSASCWQNRAEPMRYSHHWNVVEEVALQYVKWQLNDYHHMRGIACVGGNLS